MSTKDVLIIGAGIAGCALALSLAKRGVSVTLVTSPMDQRHYHAPRLSVSSIEELFLLQQPSYCPRAWDQFTQLAKKNSEELLGSQFQNVDVYQQLQSEVNICPGIEILKNHTAIELISLNHHSLKKSDLYKRPTCLGAYIYDHNQQKFETYLAKETVLATGGISSIYRYSTRPKNVRGDGIAIASRLGARLIDLDHMHFHPISLFERDRPCVPLPLTLLNRGAKVLNSQRSPISGGGMTSEKLYSEILNSSSDHLWLDLTSFDNLQFKESYPSIMNYILDRGLNPSKDLLPITPAADYCFGGIAVDKVCQTNIYRLRATGEVASTGLFNQNYSENLAILESLTWTGSCTEDIVKQINKFAYYFPEVQERTATEEAPLESNSCLEMDELLLKQIMWNYAGIIRDKRHLNRAYRLINDLKQDYSQTASPHIKQKNFLNTLQTCFLKLESELKQVSPLTTAS